MKTFLLQDSTKENEINALKASCTTLNHSLLECTNQKDRLSKELERNQTELQHNDALHVKKETQQNLLLTNMLNDRNDLKDKNEKLITESKSIQNESSRLAINLKQVQLKLDKDTTDHENSIVILNQEVKQCTAALSALNIEMKELNRVRTDLVHENEIVLSKKNHLELYVEIYFFLFFNFLIHLYNI